VEEGFLDSAGGVGMLASVKRSRPRGRDAVLDNVTVSDQYRVDL
jgi:hypothetical protein